MKIKISPYTNFNITEQAFKSDVVLNSVGKSYSQRLILAQICDSTRTFKANL